MESIHQLEGNKDYSNLYIINCHRLSRIIMIFTNTLATMQKALKCFMYFYETINNYKGWILFLSFNTG